jgi:hypothetical protein
VIRVKQNKLRKGEAPTAEGKTPLAPNRGENPAHPPALALKKKK